MDFVKVSNTTILNKSYIRWIKKLDEMIVICATQEPCKYISPYSNCFIIEKNKTPEIFKNVDKFYELYEN